MQKQLRTIYKGDFFNIFPAASLLNFGKNLHNLDFLISCHTYADRLLFSTLSYGFDITMFVLESVSCFSFINNDFSDKSLIYYDKSNELNTRSYCSNSKFL